MILERERVEEEERVRVGEKRITQKNDTMIQWSVLLYDNDFFVIGYNGIYN